MSMVMLLWFSPDTASLQPQLCCWSQVVKYMSGKTGKRQRNTEQYLRQCYSGDGSTATDVLTLADAQLEGRRKKYAHADSVFAKTLCCQAPAWGGFSGIMDFRMSAWSHCGSFRPSRPHSPTAPAALICLVCQYVLKFPSSN